MKNSLFNQAVAKYEDEFGEAPPDAAYWFFCAGWDKCTGLRKMPQLTDLQRSVIKALEKHHDKYGYAKIIARELDIGHRSVERCIENLKKVTGIRHKSQLIGLAD